jgi:lysophospholipase L1-like esterase
MVVQARHNGIAPILGLPLPVNVRAARAADFAPPLEGYDRFTKKLDALLKALVSHAGEGEAALIDLHRPFLSDTGQVQSDLFLPDGLHPNRDGHLTLAAAIREGFRGQF